MTAPEVATRAAESRPGLGRRAVQLARQPLYANALFLALNSAIGAAGGFVFWTLVARLYGAEQVGLGSAGLSALGLVAALSVLGLDMGVLRFVSGAGARRSGLINFALTLTALVGLVAGLMFLAGLGLWSPRLGFLSSHTVYAAGFVIFAAASTASGILPMAFVGMRNARFVLLLGALTQILRLALVPALQPLGAFGILTCGGAAGLLVTVAGMLLLSRVGGWYRPRPSLSCASAALLIPFGLGNHVANLGLLVPGLVLPIMVVNALGATSAAHFFIAFSVGNLVLTGTHSLATSLFAEGSHDEAGLAKSALQALMGSLLLATAGAAAMFLVGSTLLRVFGDEYARQGLGLLRLIALATVPSAVTYVLLPMLRVRKQIRALVLVSWSVCVVTLAVSYALIHRAGIAGPGIGVLAGQTAGTLLCLAYLLRLRRNAGAPVDRAVAVSV